MNAIVDGGPPAPKAREVENDFCDVTVQYGRLGTEGQALTKSLADAAYAQKHANKLVAQKTSKGYLERQFL